MRFLQPKADEEHLRLLPTSPFILHLADDGADDLTQLHRRNHSQLPFDAAHRPSRRARQPGFGRDHLTIDHWARGELALRALGLRSQLRRRTIRVGWRSRHGSGQLVFERLDGREYDRRPLERCLKDALRVALGVRNRPTGELRSLALTVFRSALRGREQLPCLSFDRRPELRNRSAQLRGQISWRLRVFRHSRCRI